MPIKAPPLLAALTTTICSLIGCSATQTYPGPARPSDQVSSVYFYNLMKIELSALTVDGINQGLGYGMTVLPGQHKVEVDFHTSAPDCPYGSSYPEACGQIHYRGNCLGTFTTTAGTAYRIEVSGIADSAHLVVKEDGAANPYDDAKLAGVGTCTTRRANYVYEGRF